MGRALSSTLRLTAGASASPADMPARINGPVPCPTSLRWATCLDGLLRAPCRRPHALAIPTTVQNSVASRLCLVEKRGTDWPGSQRQPTILTIQQQVRFRNGTGTKTGTNMNANRCLSRRGMSRRPRRWPCCASATFGAYDSVIDRYNRRCC